MGGAQIKRKNTEETELSSQVRRLFQLYKITAWRMPVGPVIHRYGSKGAVKEVWKKNPLKGFPDWAGVLKRRHRGVMFVIELKSEGGDTTPEQDEWLSVLQSSGVACAVCRSLAEVVQALREWGEIV